MSKKTIYITALHLNHGGVEKMICSLANLFVELDFKVEILCTYHLNEPAYPLVKEVSIKYLTTNKPNKEAIKQALKKRKGGSLLKELSYAAHTLVNKHRTMVQAIKPIRNSIVLSTRNEHSVLVSKHAHPSNKLIAQLHHDHHFNKKLLSDIKHRYTNMDYLLLLTDKLTHEIKDELAGANHRMKIMTVPNFLEELPVNQAASKKNQMISVGRLHPDKGFDRLLHIWSQFVNLHPDYTLLLVGDGPLKQELVKLAKTLAISKSVRFTGSLTNEATLHEIAQSKVYLMTSISEGFPLVLLEAASVGTPMVAYDVRVGPQAIIQDGYNGFLIKDNHEADFISALSQLVEDTQLLTSMEDNAKASIERFSKKKLKQTWQMILND